MTHPPDHAERAWEVLAGHLGMGTQWLTGYVQLEASAVTAAMLAYADERVAAALRSQKPAAEGATHSPSITDEERQAGIDRWIAHNGVRGRDRVVEALEKIAAFEPKPIRGTVPEQSAALGWNRAGEWAARVAASGLAVRAALDDTLGEGKG